MLTRRVFLRGSAIAMAGFGSAPRWLARAASTGQGKRKILVAIFQRGACDGLNVVAPFGEKRYYELRPSIAIAAPTTGAIWMGGSAGGGAAAGRAVPFNGNAANAIDLDGHFGLHPALPVERAVGQTAARHSGGGWLARSEPIAFRRAGLHGIGHAGKTVERWMAKPGAAAGGAGWFAAAGRGGGVRVAAHAARGASGNRAEQCGAISNRQPRGDHDYRRYVR